MLIIEGNARRLRLSLLLLLLLLMPLQISEDRRIAM